MTRLTILEQAELDETRLELSELGIKLAKPKVNLCSTCKYSKHYSEHLHTCVIAGGKDCQLANPEGECQKWVYWDEGGTNRRQRQIATHSILAILSFLLGALLL